jgi:predicted Zn finger-like uncharacterized protein
MNVSCPDCRSVFRVDPAKVPPAGVRARCSVCSGIISIPAPTGTNTPPGASPRTTPPSESAAATPAASSRPRPATETQGAWDSPPFSTPTPPKAASPSPASPPPAPTLAPPYVPSPRSGTGPSVPAAAPAAPRAATTPAASASAVSTSTPPGARRPLNPFLSKDPNQRAKRLARALVSDIITYHPSKHAEGLRDGTLKQLFREEIKKSFEEYIAQVGQQLAESTTYFQEALNEVLGGGKKIF